MAEELGAVVGELVGERYRVVRELGRGGMGVVYEALQEPLGRRVALKVLRRELAEDISFAARFRREAELAASLGHPNIAQVTDFGVDEGRPFLVMDLLIGESLAQLLAREGQLPQARAAFIAAQMLDALVAAHARGVVHRDLKPDNVFLSQISGVRDVVRLLDFGIAHASGEEATRMTRTGQVLGTPAYMSPEQARGRGVDEASDIYAVGVCLYECVSGRLPFDTGNYHELLFSIVGEEPPELGDLSPESSPEFCALVKRAMAKDAANRYPDATSMREALLPLAQAASVARGSRQGVFAVAASGSSKAEEAYAPTVTPAPEPAKQSTPAAFAATVTPATEPPVAAPLGALVPEAAHRSRRWLWMLPGLAIGALAMLLMRVTGASTPAADPPREGIQANLQVPQTWAPLAASPPAAPLDVAHAQAAIAHAALADAGSVPDAAASPSPTAAEVAPTMEPRPSATPGRPSTRHRRRTRRVDCNGHPRELAIVQHGDGAYATSFVGNHVVALEPLKRQVRARLDEVTACFRDHAVLVGRWWRLTLDDQGVVREVQPNTYCPVDPPVRACMRQLWMGTHFDGFSGQPGTVRVGFDVRRH